MINAHRKFLKKRSKIKTVTIIFYIIFSDRLETERLDACHVRFPARRGLGFRVSVKFVGISATQQKVYPKSTLWLDYEKRTIIKSVFEQRNLEKTLMSANQRDSFVSALANELVHRPTEGLRQLASVFFSILAKPMYYAAEIDRDRVTLATALSYLGLLIIFVTIVEKAVGLKELTAIDVFPVVDEALMFVMLLGTLAIFAGAMFVLMKLVGGGTGTYKKTLVTQILLAVVFLPFALLIDAGAFLLDPAAYGAATATPGTRAQTSLIGIYMIPMYSVVHHVSRLRVVLAIILVIVVLVVAVAGLLGVQASE